MSKKFCITTPIYYVNAEPHIGHAYTTILADFETRFHSLLGYDTFMLTGTDEHGDKIFEAAEQEKISTKEYADKISKRFRDVWDRIDINYSYFVRTTDEDHIKIVKDILQKVYDNGDIYFSSYGGHYCVGCERFLTEKELIDDKCPEHDKPTEYREEENYFFKMSKYQKWLIDYINDNPDFIRPEKYKNEVLSLLKSDSLNDLCISRPKSRLSWGIELPFDDKYVTYVWFDALINYISALEYPGGENFKKYWPEMNHLIAKDILKPHGIYWPTMLKSAGIDLFQNLNVHGFWNLKDAKMSKTLGNVITPDDLIGKFGNDQIRYFFLREMKFGHDSNFSEDLIINRINYDLANDFGNLINRTINMVTKFFDGKTPEFKKESPAEKDDILKKFKSSSDDYISHVKKMETAEGIEKIWEFIRFLNKYIDTFKPWALAKEGDMDTLSSVLRNLLEGIYSVTILLSPILIKTSEEILKSLNAESKSKKVENLYNFDLLDNNSSIIKPEILFPKIEKEKKAEKSKSPGEGKKKKNIEGLITIDEFFKTDMRVSEILKVTKVEGSEKLLEIKVNTGIDERIIIAGLAKEYEPEDLKGKRILVVVNLKPATIFNKTSNGMLLAAKKGKKGKPILIEINESIPLGSKLG